MKIMVGYDESTEVNNAVKLAMVHARAFGADVHLVASMKGGRDVPGERFSKVEEELAYAKSLFDKKGLACKTHLLVRGLEPGEDLVLFARETKVDEIILGVKRRSKVGKLIFGSTAQFIIMEAPCPVVTVK